MDNSIFFNIYTRSTKHLMILLLLVESILSPPLIELPTFKSENGITVSDSVPLIWIISFTLPATTEDILSPEASFIKLSPDFPLPVLFNPCKIPTLLILPDSVITAISVQSLWIAYCPYVHPQLLYQGYVH